MPFWRETAHLFKLCQQAALNMRNRYFPGTRGCCITTKVSSLRSCSMPALSQGGVCKGDSWSRVTLCLKSFSGSHDPQRKSKLLCILPLQFLFLFPPSFYYPDILDMIMSRDQGWPGFTSDELGAQTTLMPTSGLLGAPCHLLHLFLWTLSLSAFVCSEMTTPQLPGLDHFPVSDQQWWRLVSQALLQIPGNVNLMDSAAFPWAWGMVPWVILAMKAGCRF